MLTRDFLLTYTERSLTKGAGQDKTLAGTRGPKEVLHTAWFAYDVVSEMATLGYVYLRCTSLTNYGIDSCA